MADRTFTLDNEPIADLGAWAEENEFDVADLEAIARLEPGDELPFGGGAFADAVLARVA